MGMRTAHCHNNNCLSKAVRVCVLITFRDEKHKYIEQLSHEMIFRMRIDEHRTVYWTIWESVFELDKEKKNTIRPIMYNGI